MQKPTGVVLGTFGVERHMLRFTGQAAHSGSTPIPMRRDAFLAAAQTALACREIALRHSQPGAGVVCTVGVVNVEPKIVTAVPGVCEISLDQRSLDAGVLAAMVQDARDAAERCAAENNVAVEWKPLWRINPRPFDRDLIRLCEEAVREETGDAPRLPSGPLHDAAEMVPHMPVVMMFAYSSNGLSHCKEEDTPEPHLETTIRAYLRLVEKTVAHVARDRRSVGRQRRTLKGVPDIRRRGRSQTSRAYAAISCSRRGASRRYFIVISWPWAIHLHRAGVGVAGIDELAGAGHLLFFARHRPGHLVADDLVVADLAVGRVGAAAGLRQPFLRVLGLFLGDALGEGLRRHRHGRHLHLHLHFPSAVPPHRPLGDERSGQRQHTRDHTRTTQRHTLLGFNFEL